MSDNKNLITIVVRQAGSANALLPVILELKKLNIELVICAFEKAHIVLIEHNVFSYLIESFDGSLNVLANQSTLLLTGTSLEVKEDVKFWEWAKANRIPSIAYVDSWVNYTERFTSMDITAVLPDKIAVVDNVAKKRYLDLGVSEGDILTLGNPSFDSFLALSPKSSQKLNNVLLVSDPLYDFHGEKTREIYGYDEFQVFDFVLQELLSFRRKEGLPLKVTFKTHPLEQQNKYSEFEEKYLADFNLEFASNSSSNLSLVKGADLVIGMNSILLLQSALAKRPVLSIQPNRTFGNDVTDNRDGISVLTEYTPLENYFLGVGKIGKITAVIPSATGRFVNELLKYQGTANNT